MKYIVAREHLGERHYMPGDEREADPAEVEHLLRAGVLAEHKIEPPLEADEDEKGGEKE